MKGVMVTISLAVILAILIAIGLRSDHLLATSPIKNGASSDDGANTRNAKSDNAVEIPSPTPKGISPMSQDTPRLSNPTNQMISPQKELPADKLIKLALSAATKAMHIPAGVRAEIEYKGNIAVVTWFTPPPMDPSRPSPPGSDYYAKVEVDRFTGKIIKLIVSS